MTKILHYNKFYDQSIIYLLNAEIVIKSLLFVQQEANRIVSLYRIVLVCSANFKVFRRLIWFLVIFIKCKSFNYLLYRMSFIYLYSLSADW